MSLEFTTTFYDILERVVTTDTPTKPSVSLLQRGSLINVKCEANSNSEPSSKGDSLTYLLRYGIKTNGSLSGEVISADGNRLILRLAHGYEGELSISCVVREAACDLKTEKNASFFFAVSGNLEHRRKVAIIENNNSKFMLMIL